MMHTISLPGVVVLNVLALRTNRVRKPCYHVAPESVVVGVSGRGLVSCVFTFRTMILLQTVSFDILCLRVPLFCKITCAFTYTHNETLGNKITLTSDRLVSIVLDCKTKSTRLTEPIGD
jgi:hypothetical protein